ncbi:hypothetical protein DL769_007363 [Monosporascus sp. CRB-8-3]|nr:hypothetical protein DL769_007363 [Monosporascus sp. CRB-8-3]
MPNLLPGLRMAQHIPDNGRIEAHLTYRVGHGNLTTSGEATDEAAHQLGDQYDGRHPPFVEHGLNATDVLAIDHIGANQWR